MKLFIILIISFLQTVIIYAPNDIKHTKFNEIEFLVRLGLLTKKFYSIEEALLGNDLKKQLYTDCKNEAKILITIGYFGGLPEENTYVIQLTKLDELIEKKCNNLQV